MSCKWFCKGCKSDFGATTVQPYNPNTKNGHLTSSCKQCHKIFCSRIKDGKVEVEKCYTKGCVGPVTILDGTCPKCGKDELYFFDRNFEVKAVNLSKE